jgi:hypothetical protein
MTMGGKFWLGLIGACVGAVVAGSILFLVLGWAWATWGFFATFLVLGAVLMLSAYIYDRRRRSIAA